MLRSLCKVHRWWMSFLPYRSLSALMIPPPPSVTQRIRLESFNPRRSNSSSNSSQISWFLRRPFPEAQVELFPFTVHAERDHERLTAAVDRV